ncbi:MAG TPA: hypothetical protein VK145_02015 [Candidatus Nanoarchaeia archaeon]|nr:hypothetical protein [Candidatus Nanoarchaeia archaeon]
MKTIFKILIILIVLCLIAFGVFWFFGQRGAGDESPFSDGVSIGDFFPFGTTGNTPTDNPPPGDTTPNTTSTGNVATQPARFWQISSEPQSGAIAFIATGTPYVRYTDKATGNVFESKLTLTGSTRISNTTVPKVYESLWQNNGKMLVMRYLTSDRETIKSIVGTLTKMATSSSEEIAFQEVKTSFLPDNIQSLSVEPTTGAIAYLVTNDTGGRVFVATAQTPKQVYESAVKDFNLGWVNKTTIALNSKPSSVTPGQFYFLKSDTGALSRVLSGLTGLSAIANASSSQVIYSESTNGGFQTSMFDIKTGAASPLTIKTLADKCVWSAKRSLVYCGVPKSPSSGRYPDDWYQGRVSFDDAIWQIDTVSGTTKLLIDPETVGVSIDATNLSLDPNEQYVILTNKKDSRLWGLKI